MDPDLSTPTRIASGATPDLARRDARDTLGLRDKAHGHQVRDNLLDDLRDLQTRPWAEDGRALLLVLQCMDISGKDGTIRRVFSDVNPQGVRVAGFKAPSDDELDHDNLWRVHHVVPRWVRDAVVAQLLVSTLRTMDPKVLPQIPTSTTSSSHDRRTGRG